MKVHSEVLFYGGLFHGWKFSVTSPTEWVLLAVRWKPVLVSELNLCYKAQTSCCSRDSDVWSYTDMSLLVNCSVKHPRYDL